MPDSQPISRQGLPPFVTLSQTPIATKPWGKTKDIQNVPLGENRRKRSAPLSPRPGGAARLPLQNLNTIARQPPGLAPARTAISWPYAPIDNGPSFNAIMAVLKPALTQHPPLDDMLAKMPVGQWCRAMKRLSDKSSWELEGKHHEPSTFFRHASEERLIPFLHAAQRQSIQSGNVQNRVDLAELAEFVKTIKTRRDEYVGWLAQKAVAAGSCQRISEQYGLDKTHPVRTRVEILFLEKVIGPVMFSLVPVPVPMPVPVPGYCDLDSAKTANRYGIVTPGGREELEIRIVIGEAGRKVMLGANCQVIIDRYHITSVRARSHLEGLSMEYQAVPQVLRGSDYKTNAKKFSIKTPKNIEKLMLVGLA